MQNLPVDVAEWIACRRMRSLGLSGVGHATAGAVVGHLTAMQAQEHRYALWSVAQRVKVAPISTALDRVFNDGEILRTHVLRPTWHYVAPRDLRWLINLSGPRVNAGNSRRYQELELDAKTLARAADVVGEAVAEAAHTRRELADLLEAQNISSAGQRIAYIVMYAELHAMICSGPMKGNQHSYTAFDQQVPPDDDMGRDEALATLAHRYFSTRGPATLNDFAWWSGLTMSEARRGLSAAASQFSSRAIDDRTYWFSDRGATRPQPRVHLVQCYDETIISYRETRDILQTPASNVPVPLHIDGFQHVVLLDGRLLGHWRHVRGRDGDSIETRIEQSLRGDERAALSDAIDRYRRFAFPAGIPSSPSLG